MVLRTQGPYGRQVHAHLWFVILREPEGIAIATRVLAIPLKWEDKKLVGYLTREEMEVLLAAPDRTHWVGRRDHALLLTMYNSDA